VFCQPSIGLLLNNFVCYYFISYLHPAEINPDWHCCKIQNQMLLPCLIHFEFSALDANTGGIENFDKPVAGLLRSELIIWKNQLFF
jgi:hypothetical protein